MSLITEKGFSFNVPEILRELINKGCTPFICTLLSSDGIVNRVVCPDELGVEEFLENLDIYEDQERNLNTIIPSFKEMKMRNVSVTKFSDKADKQFYLLIERVMPVMDLIIFGAGHVGKSIAEFSLLMGWDVTVVDDRFEFLDLIDEIRGKIKKINEPFETALTRIKFTKNSALVIVTRGHQFDEVCLAASLDSRAFYIGMIGSKRRVLSIKRELETKGIVIDKLAKLYAPIGMNINAKTPQEIAISIIAEIISVKNSHGILGS